LAEEVAPVIAFQVFVEAIVIILDAALIVTLSPAFKVFVGLVVGL
jgi:hypothetical protein